MISGLDPEQAASVLDPLLREMATIIARHGGFVSSLRGDGLKAVFGVPMTREDHAQRACAAALEIRDKVRLERAKVGLVPIPARCWCAIFTVRSTTNTTP